MKIKEQTIKALEGLSAAEMMMLNEWIDQLRRSRHKSRLPGKWKVSYKQLHEATSGCQNNLSDEIYRQRNERI